MKKDHFTLFFCSIFIIQVESQTCDGINPYDECSNYSGCLCFYRAYPSNTTICVDGFLLSCAELVRCEGPHYECEEPDNQCIYHPRCYDYPICYPVPSFNQQFCPSLTTTSTTRITATTTLPHVPSTFTCNHTAEMSCVTTTTLVAKCESYEVSWNNHCYYLDGSASICAPGYTLSTNAILACIATQFGGKTYRSTISNNCCITTTDTNQCYGMEKNCNSAGPFISGPVLGGADCKNRNNTHTKQLTFCGSI